jgi:hypothetical protein
MLLALGLPGALVLKLWKIQIPKILKNKKYMDVAKYMHYDLANFQYEIYCFVGSGNKIQIEQILEEKKSGTVHTPRPGYLLFFLRTKRNVFRNEILHDGSVYSWTLTTYFL